jgi:glutathione S-transferase
MKLYEFAPTRSIRVRWTLQELGIEFEAVTVNLVTGEHRHPEFLTINPAGKLPVLVDGDLVISESVAIALYLAEKYADRGFTPTSLADKACFYQWLLFAATELEQPLWRISRHTSIYPEPRRLPADIHLAREDFMPMAQVTEGHLRDHRYVVGDTVTIADFVLAYTLDWAGEAQLLEDFPACRAYVERMYARPRAATRIGPALASLAPSGAAANARDAEDPAGP